MPKIILLQALLLKHNTTKSLPEGSGQEKKS